MGGASQQVRTFPSIVPDREGSWNGVGPEGLDEVAQGNSPRLLEHLILPEHLAFQQSLQAPEASRGQEQLAQLVAAFYEAGILVDADHSLEVRPQCVETDQRVAILVGVVGELRAPQGVAEQDTLLLGLAREGRVCGWGQRLNRGIKSCGCVNMRAIGHVNACNHIHRSPQGI